MTRYALLCLGLLAAWVSGAKAQGWPQKPVRIVVPFAAGGSTDNIARITADWLTQRLGATFVVDNRPGASGIIAADHVAKAAPDGYTLFLATTPQLAILPHMTRTPYDPVRDFALSTIITSNMFALAVNDTIPAKTLEDFVAYVRERPGKLAYASAGSGSLTHLTAALFLRRAGLDMIHVGYKGGAPALADVVSGHVPACFGTPADVIPFAKAGRLKVLAVSGSRRMPQMIEVPTVAEQGYAGFQTYTWNGLVAPARTPQAIVERIASEVAAAVKNGEFVKRMEQIGVEPVGSSPAEFAKALQEDLRTWAEGVRITGAKID